MTGDGFFNIEVSNLKFYAHTYLSFVDEDQKLLLKDLDIKVRYDDINFEFQNLMGGGVMGGTLNAIINVLGEEIVSNQKHQLTGILTNTFHDVLVKFL